MLEAQPGGLAVEAHDRAAHVHAAAALAGDRRADLARDGLDRVGVGLRPAVLAQVEQRLPGAVAGQLGLGAVRVVDAEAGDVAALAGRSDREHAVGGGAEVGAAQPPYVLGSDPGRLDDEVVVAERLPFLEPHGSRIMPCSSAATSSGSRPVTSSVRTSGSLRIQVSWRLA